MITILESVAQKSAVSCFCLALLLPLPGCVTQVVDSKTGEPIGQQGYNSQSAGKIRMNLGLEYLKEGDMINAKINLEKAEEHLPKDPQVLSAFAYFYSKVKNDERAKAYYERAIDVRPVSGDALNNFGTYLCNQKEYKRADEMFRRAIELPSYIHVANSYENAGMCAKEAGDLDKADRYLEQGVAYDGKRPQSLLELAQVKIELGDALTARQLLVRRDRLAAPTAESLNSWIQLEMLSADPVAQWQRVAQLQEMFPDSSYAIAYRKEAQKQRESVKKEKSVEPSTASPDPLPRDEQPSVAPSENEQNSAVDDVLAPDESDNNESSESSDILDVNDGDSSPETGDNVTEENP